ncbi:MULTISPECIES: fused MFS/spermidine synthase [unclassified Coleofasciculus]|uniref:fused MFS/spermidine synthase n=1 Tax=unclassified Coleofasciculus TaxID=2692782 RepID=UPI00187FD618|nr:MULTISPECIES: fused MFS/spermidine synthase [unclassified Coleofasciculus]MBE9127826.1 fused MFS/spermidine synthase [Coleofasciculus sp. LEGE 07081]MBE9149421.1 fused MFS/spermidine synthase [Coleofasciculus sp. LEGE 07092]
MAGSQVGADFWMSEYITPWDVYVHGVIKVLAYKKTTYQEMYIVETGVYGKALVLDGKWQSCTGDEFLYHEALVHPAMICHGSPRNVLVLGGGEGATVREILRWNTVEQVTMVDIDGEVVEACREHLPEMHQNAFDDKRTHLIIGDALEVLDNTDQQWDIVISDLSDPIEEGPSFQLFTKEYFEKVQRVLAPGGYFVVQAGPVAPSELRLHARLVNTLKAVFPNVHSYTSYTPTYGSPWGFAIASAEAIATQPDPATTDQLLQEKTAGGLQLVDGMTLLGLFQTLAYIRKAIATETEVYTLKEPPKFFGKGTLGH